MDWRSTLITKFQHGIYTDESLFNQCSQIIDQHWINVDYRRWTEDQHWSLNYQHGMCTDESLFNQCSQITDQHWTGLDFNCYVLFDIVLCYSMRNLLICINGFAFCNVDLCQNQCWCVNVSKCYEINAIISQHWINIPFFTGTCWSNDCLIGNLIFFGRIISLGSWNIDLILIQCWHQG